MGEGFLSTILKKIKEIVEKYSENKNNIEEIEGLKR